MRSALAAALEQRPRECASELEDDFDALFVSGGSPQPTTVLSSSPVASPARCPLAEAYEDSPPPSPARPPLARVSSAVLDIPAGGGDAEEPERAPLVGPSPVAVPPSPSAADGAESGGGGGGDADGGGGAAEPRKLGPNDFTILSLVGQGAFGKVFQVQKRDDGRVLAMKVMRKAHVVEKNQSEYMRTERDVLTRVEHPYIVLLHYSFQTATKLYLVLDFINGGHLFFQLYRAGIFEEPLARVYTAELVLALTHLHSLGIAHRDLKPENILLDAEGHIRVTDFGLAKVITEGSRNNSLVGTIDYMAPEIIAGRGHSKTADWWSVGVLLFEMLTGNAPFRAKNRAVLQKKILTEKVKFPTFLTGPAHKFLTALLQRDEAKRLGNEASGGAQAVQQHDFFKVINWRKLERREIIAPFKPAVESEMCTANFDEMWTKQPALDSPGGTPDAGAPNPFVGYTYSRESLLLTRQVSSGSAAALSAAAAAAAAPAAPAAPAAADASAPAAPAEAAEGPA